MMSHIEKHNVESARSMIIRISTEERQRECALREHFARFWATTPGEPRAIYDAFIGATPLAEEIVLAPVDEQGVKGWWVRPAQARPEQAILYLHGGGYVQGSGTALDRAASFLRNAFDPK